MNFSELFKDSLIYSSKNFTRVLILSLLFLIPAILVLFPFLAVTFNQYIAFVGLSVFFMIIFVILTLIINGYYLDVVKDTIMNSDELPAFQWMKNLVNGFKVSVVQIIYCIYQ
ncbi:hypothetical protein ALNOE001_21390 [Candidatus Methanobinarius endosymbioticus]|uniref:Uncharacterized protein n=1 Tax=Candidatus Methanobinarius endosymbioticus TaxID=2006182 RepID=A0A366MA61_9EURY|nr:hypothetical protein ALNOE001_21390 [Candidatus Methanobinarius endosymbioticus]